MNELTCGKKWWKFVTEFVDAMAANYLDAEDVWSWSSNWGV